MLRGLNGGIGGLLTGDHLTTSGSTVQDDLAMVESMERSCIDK